MKGWYYGSTGPVKRVLQSALTRKQSRQALSDEFRAHLVDEFQSDVEKLSRLLGRDLTQWLQ